MSVVPATNSLSDFLNQNQVEFISTTRLKVGSVYRVDLGVADGLTPDEGYETNNKIAIIIGFDHEGNAIAVVLVNTKAYAMDHPMIKSDQYPDEIVKKNSYVGTDELFIIPNLNFDYGNADYRGEINLDDMIIILESVLNCKDVPKKEKKRFRLYNELQKLKAE